MSGGDFGTDCNGEPPPLVLGSVLGGRVWNWNTEFNMLESPVKRLRWHGGVMESCCDYGSRGSVVNRSFWHKVMRSFLPEGTKLDSYSLSEHSMNDVLYENKPSYYQVYWYVNFSDSKKYLEFKKRGVKIESAEEDKYDRSIMLRGSVAVSSSEIARRATEFGARKHSFQADCSCGFYAYFSEEVNEYVHPGMAQVVGIIEGTGETVVGTKGFRSSKARIVALSPSPAFIGTAFWTERGYSIPSVHEEYAEVPNLELLEKRYPNAQIFPDPQSMYAEIKTSSVLDFV
jgi:hypothetical protein